MVTRYVLCMFEGINCFYIREIVAKTNAKVRMLLLMRA